jgi:hypothetical protein
MGLHAIRRAARLGARRQVRMGRQLMGRDGDTPVTLHLNARNIARVRAMAARVGMTEEELVAFALGVGLGSIDRDGGLLDAGAAIANAVLEEIAAREGGGA